MDQEIIHVTLMRTCDGIRMIMRLGEFIRCMQRYSLWAAQDEIIATGNKLNEIIPHELRMEEVTVQWDFAYNPCSVVYDYECEWIVEGAELPFAQYKNMDLRIPGAYTAWLYPMEGGFKVYLCGDI